MNEIDAIRLIKNMLPNKVSFSDLIGASSCYGDQYVYEEPEPYALELAIEALEKQINDRWIPVSEKLPDESGWYVITVGFNKTVYADFYDSYHCEWQDYNSFDIVAWKKMPQPYEEVK